MKLKKGVFMKLENLNTKFMTRNDCYTSNKKIIPKGIMIHSTATPGIMAKMWFERWNKSFEKKEIQRQVCVHAFVDDLEIWQYLPWDHRGWHAGGSANNTHIGIEICEPSGFSYSGSKMIGYDIKSNERYFNEALKNAISLCVYLCKIYNLTEKDIICHSEGFKKSIASNHMDVMHWFPKHNMDMDSFRLEIKKHLDNHPDIHLDSSNKKTDFKYYRVQVGAFRERKNAAELVEKLKKSGFDSFITYS
jgi:N-acetyl-anhydromuramyl-L-alanine amidase AmpD